MLDLIGNTPLLKLNKIAKGLDANVFVKLEFLNPSGSYKDRMALAMIEGAERGDTWNGKRLPPCGTVCDSSAGNTAPAVAFVSAVKGYKARLAIYKPMLRGDSTRLKITKAFGADVCESRPPEDFLPEALVAEFLQQEHDLTYIIAGKMHSYELEKANPEIVWLDQIYNKNKGLHGNLWVNQREIHQNPSSVKRQSGITAPVGRFYSVCRLTAART